MVDLVIQKCFLVLEMLLNIVLYVSWELGHVTHNLRLFPMLWDIFNNLQFQKISSTARKTISY